MKLLINGIIILVLMVFGFTGCFSGNGSDNISQVPVVTVIEKGHEKTINQTDKKHDQILKAAESYVKRAFDFYDLIGVNEKINIAEKKCVVYRVDYPQPKSIFIKEFNTSISCKTIVVPVCDGSLSEYEKLPEDAVVVINNKGEQIVYASKADALLNVDVGSKQQV